MWPFRRDPGAVPRPGEILAGKYRVEKVIGVGGMGVVVAARHTKLDEPVALKLLRPHGLRSRDDVARFLREGRACSKLKSEHVVRIIDLGELSGEVPYLVMELLEGRDLAAVLRDHGPLTVPQAIDSVLEACEAVAEAHALGIVHRDLKPANLFLARVPGGSSCVKVLDFGISKLHDDADLSLTTTRALMGSPLYMAPEVMRSARDADARSDVWALGCILYELLTGYTPFQGETVTELCARVLEETPRAMIRFRDDVPPGLEAVILRCLAKNPNDRFPNISELATALASFSGRKGAEQLEAIDRVLRAAEERQRRGRLSGATSSTSLSSSVNDTGDSTLRGWGTTGGAAVGNRRVAAIVLAAAFVVTTMFVAIFLLTRTAPGPAKGAAAPPPPLPSLSTEPATAPAPSISASAKPSASTSSKSKPIKAKPTGKPPPASPYFDDPN
jgi:eukaryotic-like serine/threonine-protein kinase